VRRSTRAALALAFAVAACGGAAERAAEPAAPPAPAPAPVPASAPTPAEAATAAPTAPPGPAVPSTAPLFEYTEDGDTLTFWTPDILRLERAAGGTPCVEQLPADGKPSGDRIEAAFYDPTVQQTFVKVLAPHAAEIDAVLTTPAGKRIRWQIECNKCMGQAKGVERLGRMLHLLIAARRAACP
jgi:hypothetical protein